MDKQEMINLLTGVQSSKKNYYAELKKTVTQLQKKNSQLELINELMRGFSVNFSIELMLKQTFRDLQDIYPIDQLAVVQERDQLTVSHILPPPDTPLHSKQLNPLFQKVIKDGQAVFYSSAEPLFFIEQVSKVSAYLIPLKSSGQTIGVLSLASYSDFPNDPDDEDFFNQLAGQIAVCLENSRLYGEVISGKQQWEETFRAVSDGIVIIQSDGTIQSQNDAARKEWKLNVGGTIHDVTNIEQLLSQTIRTKQPQSAELHLHDQIYDCSCYPLFGERQTVKAVVVYSRNITQKRQMEVQLMHSNQLVAIGEMAAGVAHELNNPLTSIIGNTQLLLRSMKADDERTPLLEDIDLCGKRCRTTIRSLLAFSRQENSPYTVLSLNEAVHEALALTKRQFESQRIAIQTNLMPAIPEVMGNMQQLSQIIINLLINAKDALLSEDLADRRIELETRVVQNAVELTVADNGPGIDPAILDELFHPFFTTKDRDSGTGLGLSVSIGLAQAHGGSLTVTVQDDPKRTIFTLTLPIYSERQ